MPKRTIYLFAYDVASPKRRYRVHRLLKGYAVGGQKSLFECWVSQGEYADIWAQLSLLIDQNEDKLHCFRLDERMQPFFAGCAKRLAFDPFLMV